MRYIVVWFLKIFAKFKSSYFILFSKRCVRTKSGAWYAPATLRIFVGAENLSARLPISLGGGAGWAQNRNIVVLQRILLTIFLVMFIGCAGNKRPVLTMHISQGFSADNGVYFITSYKYSVAGRQSRFLPSVKTPEKIFEAGTRLYYYDIKTGMLNYLTPVSSDYLPSGAVHDVKWIKKAKGYYVDIPKIEAGNSLWIRTFYDYDAKEHVLNLLYGDELTKARTAFDMYRLPYTKNPDILGLDAMCVLLKNVPFEQWQLPGERTGSLQF